MEIKVLRNILEDNMHCAASNKKYLKNKKVISFNIMASPGAGKTSFILKTFENFKDKNICVIEGDVESKIDAERLSALGIQTLQINTGGSCHLNANMIGHAIEKMDIQNESLLFVENVGNLICTAAFDLGTDYNIVILSAAEGDDKPYKYPQIFEKADVIILNKIDLIPFVEFSKEKFYSGIRALNNECSVFEISCRSSDGIDQWINWLSLRCNNEAL